MKSPWHSTSSFSCWCSEQILGFKPIKEERGGKFWKIGQFNFIGFFTVRMSYKHHDWLTAFTLSFFLNICCHILSCSRRDGIVSLFLQICSWQRCVNFTVPCFETLRFLRQNLAVRQCRQLNTANHGADCLIRICKVQIEHDVIHDLKVKNINVDCFKSTGNTYLWHFYAARTTVL